MTELKLRVFLWICLAHIMYYSATAETPKECAYGTSDFNETLCIETCTKTTNANESYCANFTQPTANTQNQSEPQEAVGPVALSGIMSSTPQEGIRFDFTTLKIMLNDSTTSSAVSVEAPLKVSAIVSLCGLFFAYF